MHMLVCVQTGTRYDVTAVGRGSVGQAGCQKKYLLETGYIVYIGTKTKAS